MHTLEIKRPNAALPNVEPARRFIVLFPTLEVNFSAAARRLWEIARSRETQILLLGLCRNPIQESRLRRDLITLAAMLRDETITTKIEIAFEKNWIEIIRARFQSGDALVCFAEQNAVKSIWRLSQALQNELNIPLYTLSDLLPQK